MMKTFHDMLPAPVQRVGELQVVITPEALAERMLDIFPPEVWKDKDKKWLVPVSKSGIFELRMFVRLMNGLSEVIPNKEERRDWIVRKMIWSFAPTFACALSVKGIYACSVWNTKDVFGAPCNISTRDFLKVKINKEGAIMMCKSDNGEEKYMKFDCVVRNPPYQDNSKANDPKNIYPDFVLKAIELKPQYASMVIPARWMMGSGKGIQSFLETMVKSKSLSKMIVEKNSSNWFPDVEIKGGVMYFLYDRDHNSGASSINDAAINLENEDVIIDDSIGISIKSKVMAKCDVMFDSVMLGGCPFGITSTHNEWSGTIEDSYVCHNSGRGKSSRECFVRKQLVKRNVELIDKYKVCTAKGYGNGSDGIGMPFIVPPNHVVSESYLVLYCSDSELHANNAKAFLSRPLTQYLISLLKNTQNVAKRVFKYVPYLDLSRFYTDQDLYTIFGLSKEEVAHIENVTKDFPIFRNARRPIKNDAVA